MLRNEKEIVRDFHESFGWSKNTTGTYNDTASFVDLRPVLSSYYHDTQMRVRRFLNPSGKYLLDAGSGPVSQPEYLLYSSDYSFRVCIDLSVTALQDARRKLNAHGLYVIGDLGNMPFREGTFDATLASHVLYHLPEDEQAGAVRELYRTLKEGGTGAIIYIWPASVNAKVKECLARARRSLIQGLSRHLKRSSGIAPAFTRQEAPTPAAPPLYFHPHNYAWIRHSLAQDWKPDIRVWRSVGIGFTRAVIGDNILGRVLLRIIYWIEELFPHALARIGRYPIILIHKVPAKPKP